MSIINDNSSVVRFRIVGKYNNLYEMCKNLQKARNKYRDVQLKNENDDGERVTIKVNSRCRWFSCRGVECDAEKYYGNLITLMKKEVRHTLRT